MTENLLIAIGGTGAKVVESILPCIGAGLGPENLSIAFVDQDEGNGNVARSKQRLANYRALHRIWNHGEHRLAWTGAGATPFARTNAEAQITKDDVWCPHQDRTTSLAKILNRPMLDEGAGQLMDVLFHSDEREQTMKLGEGYRGQPHIGATAMVSRVLQGAEFWSNLNEKIRSTRAGEEVRVFLAGSVFGGTGAAGFPTIARVIRDLRRGNPGNQAQNQEQDGQEVRLGGLLMLPYFSFSPPKPGENAARPENLLIESQGAIRFYARLLQTEKIFNQIYLMGWSPNFQLGYGEPGAGKQRNPPLPPELIGALACLKFFNCAVPREIENTIYICSRSQKDTLIWDDLPSPISDDPANDVQYAVGQLLRFCLAWRNTTSPELEKRRSWFNRPAWLVRQEAGKITMDGNQRAAVSAVDQFVDDTLTWAASMRGFGLRGGLSAFQLWDLTRICEFNASEPTDPVKLLPPLLDDDRAEDAYSHAILGLSETQKGRSQGEISNEISEHKYVGDGFQGLGRLVASIFKAARLDNSRGA